MPPKKSIFRGPNAQHFQLVHRSQRDPLINDPEASQRVLKPVGRPNDRQKSGYTLAELETALDKSSIRENEGEAALYGITYDDSSYDYMSHLRPVGQPGAFDSVLLPAPRGSGVAPGMKGQQSKGKGKAKAEELFLPDDVFASREGAMLSEKEVWERAENVPAELRGLNPDMDPHLRQVLEALEDDAFVDGEEDGGEGDGWFDELVGGGEVYDPAEREDFEFAEWGVDEDGEEVEHVEGEEAAEGEPREETWEDRFKAFKAGKAPPLGGVLAGPGGPEGKNEVDDAERSEMLDTVGSLGMGEMLVKGGKKRRGKRGPSDASGMSMSSSSMWRNEGLRDLDERFDKVERDYELDDDEDDDFLDDVTDDDGTASIAPSAFSTFSRASAFSRASTSSSHPAPELSREDFNAIMDDFLENYEVVGRKYKQALGGTNLTGPEKLQVLRAAVDGEEEEGGIGHEENRRRILELERLERAVGRKGSGLGREEKIRIRGEEDQGDKWDVETILSTYSNTENHPATIRLRTLEERKKRAERVAAPQSPGKKAAGVRFAEEEEEDKEDSDDSGSETEREGPKITVSRPKGESSEVRKARKAAVKAERSARRAEKKTHKQGFTEERRRQLASHKKLVGGGRAADLSVGQGRGVVSLS